MAKLSKILPIYDVLNNGCVISDSSAALSYCFKLKLPFLQTMDEQAFGELIEDFRKFMELIGEDTIFHKQDFFFPEKYRHKIISDNFMEQSYSMHFDGRMLYKMYSFLYISKIDSSGSGSLVNNFISNSYAKTNEIEFLNTILNSAEILKKHNVFLELLNQEDLLNPEESPISMYYNLSDRKVDEIKDIDFKSGLKVGNSDVYLYTIENLSQFPREEVHYCKNKSGLPVSNLFDFSYKLAVPHVLNQIIYFPPKNLTDVALEKHQGKLEGYNYKGSNDEACSEISILKKKTSDFNVNYAYFHTNVMAFGDKKDNIDKLINIAFSNSGFKKKENFLSRKDIFLGSFPTNSIRIVKLKKHLMSLMMDLEALCYFNFEQNYDSIDNGINGVRLCDTLYGIPFSVDIFDKPKKEGWIKNQNTIVLSGSGGGKSFTVNHIVNSLYRDGAHFFCLDASYSYRLQSELHGGVYLTFDNDSRISFNPFYLDWIDNPKADNIFLNLKEEDFVDSEGKDKEDVEILINDSNYFNNLLTDKVSVLNGLIFNLAKDKEDKTSKSESSIVTKLLFNYFKDRHKKVRGENGLKYKEAMCFDDFYNFSTIWLPEYINEKGLTFEYKDFLEAISLYCSGQLYGYLLNSIDPQIKNIDQERFVVIDISRVRDNAILFDIISLLSMDLYNQKVAKLPQNVKKILCVDEAWQAFTDKAMATFLKKQVKVVRKYGGLTIFISQELDDFVASPIIAESIINNSAIKIFADMGEFKAKFDRVTKLLSLTESNEKKILSLNQNNRNKNYREICICWGNRGQVFAVEVPTELKAIYETDADQVAKIMPLVDKYGVELAALNYANRD